ncbi:uncharacterized protein LOC130055156 [Ostrea edulis]|uniref:uncharacterized protein LOC130055156 n=1 Tax=Ostrea edulis TaxID=37623 RepID=UPI0024AED5DC|nr:uncharacterized protein LOC130055156 [Ostrea edulis]
MNQWVHIEMPGEQLTCVLQIAHTKCGGSSLQKSAISEVFALVNAYKCFCYTKKEFSSELSDIVAFSQLKDFIISKRDKKSTRKEIQDRLEIACWRECKRSYSRRVFTESDVFKLWQIFNRLTNEESYPPVISQRDADWALEKFVAYATRKKEAPCEGDLTFQSFLSYLESIFDPKSIVQPLKEIYEWLVKEVIKSGWVYMRSKRRFNWSSWSRKWVTLTPGKIYFSRKNASEDSVMNTKGVFYISEQTSIQVAKAENKKMKPLIHVSNSYSFECHITTEEENEINSWISALNDSLKHCKSGTSPLYTILKAQSPKHSTSSNVNRSREREKSFILSAVKRKERKDMKEREKNESQTKVNRGCFLRMNSVNTEREKIKAVFLGLDKNGKGYLNETEFSSALRELGLNLSNSESRDIFRNIDTNGDGKVMFDEFYDYFLEKILSQENSLLMKAFIKADKNGSGAINFKEFSEFLRDRHIALSLDQVLSTFDKACKDELSFEDFQCMSFVDEIGIFQDPNEKFEAQMKLQFDSCDSNVLKNRIEKRWQKFASFRRQGENGNDVMKGASGIVEDIVPGEYKMEDLAKFRDLPKLLPKVTIVKGVSWESSDIPDTSGNLVFPHDFSGQIEAEIATGELLEYYGCTFAEGKSEKVSLPYRHAVQDFTYKNDYLADYVEKKNGGAGLERHGFSHIDCPLDEDSGFFILGKMDRDELHLTAFKIPRRQTLYIPGNCIHSNDYLKGTWRTMLSDETNIDHVHLKKKPIDDEESCLEPFTFMFSL